MLTELRAKSQVTIPEELIAQLDLHEGDTLEIYEKNGAICIEPVAVYPRGYLEELRSEIEEIRARLAAGESGRSCRTCGSATPLMGIAALCPGGTRTAALPPAAGA